MICSQLVPRMIGRHGYVVHPRSLSISLSLSMYVCLSHSFSLSFSLSLSLYLSLSHSLSISLSLSLSLSLTRYLSLSLPLSLALSLSLSRSLSLSLPLSPYLSVSLILSYPPSPSPSLDYGLNGNKNNSSPLSVHVHSICRDGDNHLFMIFLVLVSSMQYVSSTDRVETASKTIVFHASMMVMGKSVFDVMQPFAPTWFKLK